MNPNRQRLRYHGSTARALLGGVARINQYDHPTSVLSFVRGVRDQLMPGCIRDALRQTMILKHVFPIQLFEGNHAETSDPFMAQLMNEVPALIGNALMDVLNCLTSPGLLGSPLLRPREFPLSFGQFLLIPAKEAGILNLHAIGQGGEAVQPNLNPHHLCIERQPLRFYFASQAGIPIPNCIPPDRKRFDAPFQGTMQNDFHHPNFRKVQTILQQLKTGLFEGEAVVPTLAPKSGIPRLLTRFYSAKEGLESLIHTCLHILQHLRVHAFQIRMRLFPDREQYMRITQRKRFPLLLPGMFANTQRFIVNPTAELQGLH
jgi:hypothetical protein